MALAPMNDVVVLGGGPAGTSAAIWCATKGLSTVLIEASAFPRHRPGETLHPGVEPILAQLGVIDQVRDAGFLRHEGLHVEWGGPEVFRPYGHDGTIPWLGYQAGRAELDNILIRRARDLGVCVLQPCIANRPIIEAGRVSGILTTDSELRARFVLDGSGSVSWLARRLGLRYVLSSRRLTAHYGYTGPSYKPIPHLPKLRQNRNGWTWIARVQPNRYHWTTLTIGGDRSVASETPRELRSAEPRGQIRSVDVSLREVFPAAGPGYFLLGDAAMVLDPLSSHGVLKALISGIWAAHLIDRIQRGLSEKAAAAVYANWVHDWFRHDSRELAAYYRHIGLEILPN